MPNKSLGQHWLKDRLVLEAIADSAEITPDDTVLEIGPGLGTLTSALLARAKEVIAVEFDGDLARKLPAQFPGKRLTVVNQDILSYDFEPLSALPGGFKIVGNIPYYITNKIVRKACEGPHRPHISVLLVQKEVAERLAALPGQMSILAISAQVYAEVTLGELVPRTLFTPPPQVDSQVVIMRTRATPLVSPGDETAFFQVVKAGFSAKRKKLRSSLAGGLQTDKIIVEQWLLYAGIDADARAQDLSIEQWQKLANIANVK